MTPLQQAAANFVDSKLTTFLGLGIIGLGILCDSGVIALYLPQATEHAWCIAISKVAVYAGGGALVVSRSPITPPR